MEYNLCNVDWNKSAKHLSFNSVNKLITGKLFLYSTNTSSVLFNECLNEINVPTFDLFK